MKGWGHIVVTFFLSKLSFNWKMINFCFEEIFCKKLVCFIGVSWHLQKNDITSAHIELWECLSFQLASIWETKLIFGNETKLPIQKNHLGKFQIIKQHLKIIFWWTLYNSQEHLGQLKHFFLFYFSLRDFS